MQDEIAGGRVMRARTRFTSEVEKPAAHAGERPLYWRLGWIDVLFAALALLETVPVWLVRYPQNGDYLNHLARLFVLTAPAADPIHHFYRVHWHLMPNLGLEIVALPLAQLLPIEAVMKIVWALSVLGTGFAVWFLHRSLVDRAQPSLLVAALVLINLPLTIGLFSFTLGLQVTYIAIGLWFRMGERATLRSLLMLNAMMLIAVIIHVAAAAALMLTIGVLYVLRRPFALLAMARRAALIATGFIAPVLLVATIVLSQTAPRERGFFSGIILTLSSKFNLVVAPVYTGNYVPDLLGALIFWISLLLMLVLGRAKLRPGLGIALGVWLVMIMALPFRMGGEAMIDVRLGVIPVILLIASLSIVPERRVVALVLGGIVTAGALARLVVLLPAWFEHDAKVASFRAIASSVERGTKLISGEEPPIEGACPQQLPWQGFEEHIPVLLVIDRADFVSTVFDRPGVQPIEPMPDVEKIFQSNIGVIPWDLLIKGETEAWRRRVAESPPGALERGVPVNWRRDFDYIAIRRSACTQDFPPQADFVPVGDSTSYRIYRIVHAPALSN